MSIRPAFLFYPSDWRNNLNLRRCTPTQRGAWMDILCVLHEADEYGLARVELKFIASWSGVDLRNCKALVKNNVLKGSDSNFPGFVYTPRTGGRPGAPVTLIEPCAGPCWYSSRLVRDEYVRSRRGLGARFTSNNQPQTRHQSDELVQHQSDELVQENAAPIGRIGERVGDGPSSSSSIRLSDRDSKTDRVEVHETSPTRRVGEKKTGTRWPPDAVVPDDWIEAAADKRHDLGLNNLDLAVEAEMFANYWSSKAGAAATKIDWRKTWMNWSLNSSREKFNGKHPGNGRKPTAIDNHLAGIASLIGDIRKGRA